MKNKIIYFLLLTILIVGIIVPMTVLADEPCDIDTTVMTEGSNGKGYSGSKDAAFEIVDDTLKIKFRYSTTLALIFGGDEELKSVETGYINDKAADWIDSEAMTAGYPFTFTLNGTTLSTNKEDSTYGIVSNGLDETTYEDIIEITIKPGIEISEDFFDNNQIVFEKTTTGEKAAVGKYSGSAVTPDDPEPTIKPAKVINPAKDYRVATEINTINNLVLMIKSDSDQQWIDSLTEVTYSYDGNEPADMVIGKGGLTTSNYVSLSAGSEVAVARDAYDTYIGIHCTFFQSIPKGESREYTFTFKANGYEDSVVKQTVRNPKEVLEVSVNKGAKYNFALEDLQKMWKEEGSKEYTYSVYDTIPDVLEQEKHYGPTLKAVLAAAKIDLDSLADDDVIELSTASNSSLGYKARITVKDLKQKRYTFPNGASTNGFKGSTEKQLEGKSEVPYIISIKGGESGLRNIFGQIDPQDEQKYDWVDYLGKITVYKGTAIAYDGLTPTLDNGSTYKKGDKLNFDFSTSGWQAGTAAYAGIYYTVSTDGTEPADPTMSDIFYNFRQYGSPSYKNNPEYFNSYEFTNDEKTIIKVAAFIRGYAEPKVITLTYTHDHVAASPVKEKEVAATCTEAGSYEEVVNCSECGAEISREAKTIEALGHKKADPVKENEVAATCTKEGSYEEVVYCSVCKEELSREKKSVSALGHDEKVSKEAKEATCTEDGWTEETICTRCGETIHVSEPIAAKGHSEEVIPEVLSTCTEKGWTSGIRCSVCGEILKAPEEVPMIRHDYDDHGICTVCGAKDPDYVEPSEPSEPSKPAEPEEPVTQKEEPTTQKQEEPTTQKEEPTTQKQEEPAVVKEGRIVKKNPSDGKWYLYNEGAIDWRYTGIAPNQYGWWRIVNGKVNFNATGVYRNEYGWWRVEDGKVNFKAQGIYKNAYGWWKTTDGKVTFKETGVFKNEYGWWRVEDSKVNFKANSIYKNDYGWWKTTDGKVTFKETGIFKNKYGTWYVKNSKVDFSKNGKVTYKGKTYTVTNGYAKRS